MEKSTKIRLLGVRGSLPVSGTEFVKYGGATSCIFVNIGGEAIYLDAGTGIVKCPELTTSKKINILISHSHVDHILGFPMCPFLYDRNHEVNVYLATRGGFDANAQMAALMSPPLWPLDIGAVETFVQFHDVTDYFNIGKTKIETMESNHPGGSTIYKLTAGEKSLVYATDFEHDGQFSEKLAKFARDCGVLIYDSQYLDSEYPDREGWGHSTYEEGIKMGERCGAGLTVLYHHDSQRTDEQLDEITKLTENAKTPCVIGKCGEEFTI